MADQSVIQELEEAIQEVAELIKTHATKAFVNTAVSRVSDAVEQKQDKLTFDSTPTENSNNPVTSGGVYSAIEPIQEAVNNIDLDIKGKGSVIIDSASGSIASFTDGADDLPMKSAVVNIEPIQEGSGDPSPENVRAISGRTGLGVNVWDEETEYGYYSAENGQAGSSINTQLRSKNYISVKPSTSYCFKKPNNLGDILFYDANKSYISALLNVGSNRVFTTPGNCYYIRLNLGSVYGNTYNHDIGLNYPATNTEYHAYKGSTYSVNWESEAGTVYGGTLDVVSGKLMVDRAKITFDGSQSVGTTNWRPYDDTSAWLYKPEITPGIYNVINSLEIVCDKLKSIPYEGGMGGIYANNIGIGIVGTSTYAIGMRVPVSGLTTAALINAWLSENPITAVYKLSTPTEIQLTPQEVRTLLGENNIWSDAGDMTVEYPADTKLYIDQKITEAIAAALA